MADVIGTLYSWLSFLPQITKTNVLEIAIIAFLIYEIMLWIKNTRAWTLLKGLVVILAFAVIAWLLKLYTILWILQSPDCHDGAADYFSAGTAQGAGTAGQPQSDHGPAPL